jgi:hypothetical protein
MRLLDADADLAPQNLDFFIMRGLFAPQQPQAVAHHLAGRRIDAGCHLGLDKSANSFDKLTFTVAMAAPPLLD